MPSYNYALYIFSSEHLPSVQYAGGNIIWENITILSTLLQQEISELSVFPNSKDIAFPLFLIFIFFEIITGLHFSHSPLQAFLCTSPHCPPNHGFFKKKTKLIVTILPKITQLGKGKEIRKSK